MPFTPVQTFIGAAMMGLAANNVLVLNGGVLGVSGFAHRTVASLSYLTRKALRGRSDMETKEEANPDPEQLAALSIAGLLAGGLVLGLCRGQLDSAAGAQLLDIYASSEPDWRKALSYILGGLFVGLGSKPRSLVATGTFFPAALVTHIVLGKYAPFSIELAPEREVGMPSWWTMLLLQTPLLVYTLGGAFLKGFVGEKAARRLVAFSTTISGMLRPSKILDFLRITPSAVRSHAWDGSLLFVIVAGIIPQLLVWRCCLGAYTRQPDSRPKFAESWSIPKVSMSVNWREGITVRLVIGLFGDLMSGDWRVHAWRVGIWSVSFVVGGVIGGLF
ncbi:hypothetical protein RhiJN_03781 [Ceratobasidium sp. AG-Ba]|nr:hypothetical protein RhiJN_03781 [Ceratobasidium sp. AG-Ba]